jgi:hypothetical protein
LLPQMLRSSMCCPHQKSVLITHKNLVLNTSLKICKAAAAAAMQQCSSLAGVHVRRKADVLHQSGDL